MDVFDLVAKITLDSTQYDAELDTAQENVKGFGDKITSVMKVAGGAITAVVGSVSAVSTAFVKATSDLAAYGDRIDKMSQKFGISATALQEWDAVLQHSGTDISVLQSSMRTLVNAAQSGSEAFEQLGISQARAASMSQEDLFSETIKALQNVEDQTQRTYLANKLLGRGAMELGALLNTSAEDTQKMKDRVHELNGVLSDEAVKASAAYQDSLQDMKTAFEGLKRNITSEFLPSVTSVMDGLTELFAGNSDKGLAAINSGIMQFTDNLSVQLPQALNTASQILLSITDAVTANLPALFAAGSEAITTLGEGIVKELPEIAKAGLLAIQSLTDSIVTNIPDLIPAAISAVDEIADTLTSPDRLQELTHSGLDLMKSLANGIGDALPKLADTAVDIVLNIADFILDPDNISAIISCGVEIVSELTGSIISSIPKLIEGAGELAGKLVDAIFETDWLEVGAEIGTAIVDGVMSAADKIDRAGRQLGDRLYKALNGQEFSAPIEKIRSELESGYFSYFDDVIGESQNALRDFAQEYADVLTDTGEGFAFRFTGTETLEYMSDLLHGLQSAMESTGQTEYGGVLFTAYNSIVRESANITAATQEIEALNKSISDLGYSTQYLTSGAQYIPTDAIRGQAKEALKEIEIFSSEAATVASASAKTAIDKSFATLAIGEYKNLGVKDILGHELTEIEQNADRIASTVYSVSVEYANRQIKYLGMNYDEQIDLWQEIQSQFIAGSKQYLDAEEKIFDIRQRKLSEATAAEKSAQEAAEKAQKKATEEYEKELKEREKALEDYKKKISDINSAISNIELSYTNELTDRTQEIFDSFSLFEKVPDRIAVSGIDLMSNLQGQYDAISKFYSDLDTLSSRGVSESLAEQIRSMGVSALDQLDALLDLDAEQLKKYDDLFIEKQNLSASIAEKELAGLKQETEQKIADEMASLEALNTEAAENLGLTFAESIAEGIMSGASAIADATSAALVSATSVFGGEKVQGAYTYYADEENATERASVRDTTSKSKTSTENITVNINGIQYQNFSDLVKAVSEEIQFQISREAKGYVGA